MIAWRQDLHAHPETAFEEHRTAQIIADRLKGFGLEVHQGLAKTGVVGVLRGQKPGPAIALRADMDALHLTEKNDFEHRSTHAGRMHACGHDGHMAMLLGAAQHLAATRNFSGTVYFIFQPAEENEAGAQVMVADGLFERFPAERVFGMHNWPGMPVGQFSVRSGPVMAAADTFSIQVEGQGAHAAMPHLGLDPVVIAAQIVTALQTITSRTVDPYDSAVVSVTRIHGGETFNVIPDRVELWGTARAFRPEVQDTIEASIRRIATGISESFGATCAVDYQRRYPATVNTDVETELAATAAARVVGVDQVQRDRPPSMGAEDFAYMLKVRPGAYVWIGNGEGGCTLHNPHYDFNDAILPIGAAYWISLVQAVLGAAL